MYTTPPKGPLICVEDDEDDQLLLQEAFNLLAIPNPIHFFADGHQALHYLETTREQPFLILCDINMPRLNGLELRRQIMASDYLRQKAVPFVFLTTAASQEYVAEAYRESVQGFYEKATDYVGLCRQLKQIVEYWQNCLHPNSF